MLFLISRRPPKLVFFHIDEKQVKKVYFYSLTIPFENLPSNKYAVSKLAVREDKHASMLIHK
jgi:hypothetical protein